MPPLNEACCLQLVTALTVLYYWHVPYLTCLSPVGIGTCDSWPRLVISGSIDTCDSWPRLRLGLRGCRGSDEYRDGDVTVLVTVSTVG